MLHHYYWANGAVCVSPMVTEGLLSEFARIQQSIPDDPDDDRLDTD